MRWVEDEASRRWYIVEDDNSTRWPTPQEEAQRLAEAAARESAARESAARAARESAARVQASPFPVAATAATPHGRSGGSRAARRSGPLVPIGTGVLGLVVGLVAGFAVGAARGGSGTVTPVAGASASASPSAGRDAAADPAGGPSAEGSDAPRDDANPRFGDAVDFDDGSRLTCAKPVAFQRDRFAAGGEGRRVFLKVKCRFDNSSGSTFEPIGTVVGMSAGGEEGDQVFQEGLDLPTNPVLDGKSVTWWTGFGVASKKDVQVSVNVGFLDYDTVVFS